MRRQPRQSAFHRHPALQQLFALQEYSLARYAAQASLYGSGDAQESLTVIKDIAKSQTDQALKIGGLLTTRRVHVERSGFPLSFTRMNYVAADYVAGVLLSKQSELLPHVRACIAELSSDQEGQSLAQDVFHCERENLRKLQRVAPKTLELAQAA